MRKLKIVILLLTLTFIQTAFCQELRESEVPKTIVEQFKKKYPNVYVYEWEFDKKKMIYEAEFIMKGHKHEAVFTPQGEWIKTERDIEIEEVPQLVLDSFSKTSYSNWKVEDYEIHSTSKYELVYVIEVKSNKQKALLYFLPSGELVEEIKK